MPNIEFVGFTREEYEEQKPNFDAMLKKIGLHKTAVTTFMAGSLCESCDGSRKRMPYLHIFSSVPKHIKVIVDGMISERLFFDTQGSDNSFITAEEMESKYKSLAASKGWR